MTPRDLAEKIALYELPTGRNYTHVSAWQTRIDFIESLLRAHDDELLDRVENIIENWDRPWSRVGLMNAIRQLKSDQGKP